MMNFFIKLLSLLSVLSVVSCESADDPQSPRFLRSCYKNVHLPVHVITNHQYVRMKVDKDSLVLEAGQDDYIIQNSIQTTYCTQEPILDLSDSTSYEFKGQAMVMGIGDYTYGFDEESVVRVEVLAHAYESFNELARDLRYRWESGEWNLPVKTPTNVKAFDVELDILCITASGRTGGGQTIGMVMGAHESVKSKENEIKMTAFELISDTPELLVYQLGFEFKGEVHDLSNRIDDFVDISGEFHTQILVEK